jgi:hypothetical protein
MIFSSEPSPAAEASEAILSALGAGVFFSISSIISLEYSASPPVFINSTTASTSFEEQKQP